MKRGITIHLSNKVAYTLMIFLVLAIISVGVYAYTIDNSGTPSVMGHSADELEIPWTKLVDDIYYTSGKVGIGTNNPTEALEIYVPGWIGGIKVDGGNGGGCLIIGDTNGGGFTYCNALDGVLTCSINPCEGE